LKHHKSLRNVDLLIASQELNVCKRTFQVLKTLVTASPIAGSFDRAKCFDEISVEQLSLRIGGVQLDALKVCEEGRCCCD
jgi:hypothetical protein